jgi:hypothetical protein
VLLVGGEVAGTWRRSEHQLSVRSFTAPAPRVRQAVEAEATSLPLPGLRRSIAVRWDVE